MMDCEIEVGMGRPERHRPDRTAARSRYCNKETGTNVTINRERNIDRRRFIAGAGVGAAAAASALDQRGGLVGAVDADPGA